MLLVSLLLTAVTPRIIASVDRDAGMDAVILLGIAGIGDSSSEVNADTAFSSKRFDGLS